MNNPKKSDAIYAVGDSSHERKRLQEQANLVQPFTSHLFEQAGITSGMRVLDVGSGTGDVAFLVAEMVGTDGAVVSVDNNPAILETARTRAEAGGYKNISFVAGDIRNVTLDGHFDAVVERNVLLYLANPVEATQRIAGLLHPKGIVAFQEIDMTTSMISVPHCPLSDKIRFWVVETFHRAGMETQMGFKLRSIFINAGLPEPQMHLDAMIGGGENWGGYSFLGNTVRSMLPFIEKFGIATADEIDIETLADRYRNEVVSQNAVVMMSTWVSAWTQM